MITCWKCNKELPDSTTTCPDCQSNVTKKVVDNMMTIGPGGGPTSQILPGMLVANRYEIKQEIGRGGMGIVYLAHDKTMEHDVALKVIPQELCMDPKAVADLKRETSIALKLSHSHIMRLHNLDTWEGQAFVVMELVDGGTLAHLMADKGVFPLDDALVYLKQMADALDYSHRSVPAVVHRDLKPLNILLNDQGEVKIADYGLARVLRDSASRISNQDSAGTLSYMAPEQVKGKGIGKAVDIYALAAIAYEMLSGNPPFYTGDLRWQIVHEEVDLIEGQPEHVNQALLRALSKEKEDRPETAGEFVVQLAGEQEVGKRPKKKKKRRVRREASGGKGQKKTGMIVGGLLLVVLLAAGGWFLSGKDSGPKNIFQSEPILTISSDPAGATVYVDEGEVGQTPTQVENLPDGTHEVRLTKEKYIGYEKKIFIQQGNPIALAPALEPEPYGDLHVMSDPSGATILVDGKKMGMTPATLEHLKKGTRQIVLKKEEYDPWHGNAEIVPLEATELKSELVTIYGRLEITSIPPGADVLIDGKQSGTTPFSSERIKKGKRKVEVTLSGFDSWIQEVEVALANPVILQADLETLYGRLKITSTPSGATVYLDGKKQGTTPQTIIEVKKGGHHLELKLSGYDNREQRVEITAGQENSSHADLNTIYGSLSISSNPTGAVVYLDGKKQGETPQTIAEVIKGRRQLELKLSGYDTWQEKVNVVAGKAQQVKGDLVSSFGSLEITSTPSGATVLIDGKKQGETPFSSDTIAKGKHKIILELTNHTPWAKSFSLAAGGNQQYSPTLELAAWRELNTGMEFVPVKGGCYQMGDTFGDGVFDEKPVHEVCVDGFYMGKYEVTQGEYRKITGSNPSSFKKGNNYPVENVPWNDAQDFIRKLNSLTGKSFRLPTEAEWEYAARSGGKKQKYAGSNTIDSVAWYMSNSEKSTHPVGQKSPNGLGLYDMSGNVWEWCSDWYGENYYQSSPSSNPQGPSSGSSRVLRGGGIYWEPAYVRTALRNALEVDDSGGNGFRLVSSGQ